MSVISTHNAGFFSCCAVKLSNIISFYNANKRLPNIVDSSAQFAWYKNKVGDITYDYFQRYNDILCDISYTKHNPYHHDYQFLKYTDIDYSELKPFITKYFSLADPINSIVSTIKTKYNIDYNNTCVLFYRGNDKNRETTLCSYNEYIEYANRMLANNPTIQFLIQSDESEFIEMFTKMYPSNTFYFKDEIRHMRKCNSTVDITMRSLNNVYSKYYLAITYIMSQCKYIICGSGNCSVWIMYYRGHANNILQNLNGVWYDTTDSAST